MKSTLCLPIVLSLAILAGAIPTYPSRVPRVSLQRVSRNTGDPTSVQSAMGERFLGGQRVADLMSYTHEKYANTFAAYEKNTGSRHPLDPRWKFSSTPSKRGSNGAIALRNQKKKLWYGSLTIGTPPQNFTVDFDTGSADLIVSQRTCLLTCDGHNKYDPYRSSTSIPKNCPFGVLYGSGAAIGVQYEDKVDVGGFEITKQRFGGANVLSEQFWSKNFEPDGISGLAFKQISSLGASTLMDNLKESGQLRRLVFSFLFSDQPGKSELIIGDTDDSAFDNSTLVSIPVTQPGYWQVELDELSRPDRQVSNGTAAIIDTGTTLILAPPAIVNDYYQGINGAKCGADGVCTVPCNTINSTAPTLTFGGRRFTVSAETWNLGPVTNDSTDCFAGLGAFQVSFMIIGDVFLQNVYTIFDFSDDPRVQFAELA